MKVGFSNSIFDKVGYSILKIVEKGSKIGYDGLELNPREIPSEIDITLLRKVLGKEGFEIAAVGTKNAYLRHNSYLASPEKEKREFVLKYVKDCCILAEKLNCSIVQLGITLMGSKIEEAKELAKKRLLTGLEESCRIASEYGVEIIIEPINRFLGQLLNTFEEAVGIINEVDAPNIWLMGDLFHMNIEERSIEDSIIKSKGFLKYLHVNDSNRLAPGEGHLDFVEIFRALEKVSYDSYLTLEILPKPSPEKALEIALQNVRSLL